MPTIKGTASVADDHAMAKQLKQTKFSKIFSKKVRIDKVNVPVMSQWIEKRIAEILGFEDEIVASMAINLFLEPQDGMDPRRAQLNLAGFLGDEQSALFCDSLWRLLLDAQDQTAGIPTVILEEKKAKMQLEKAQQEARLAEERRLRLPNHDTQQRRPVEYSERGQRGREHERRPLPPPNQYNRHPQGNRVPLPRPRPISPARPSVDEFGRVTQNDDDVRKPRAQGGDRDRPSTSPRDRGDIEHQREGRSRRSAYREEHRGRHYSDDRRRFQREYPRYNERDEYRRRRPSEERRRRRSRSSSSSSRSRSSPSRSRSRSTSRSRSPF